MPVTRGFWQITVVNSHRLGAFLSIIVKRNAKQIQVTWTFHEDEFVLRLLCGFCYEDRRRSADAVRLIGRIFGSVINSLLHVFFD